MKQAIVFDCEFLTAEGSPSRFWCGPKDPDPVIAQIGLVKLGLEQDFPILGTERIYVLPVDRQGARWPLDPFFTRLTGITEEVLDRQAVPLGSALKAVEDYADGARLWSWGKDEFNMVAISCYVAGLVPPLPVTRFGNACDLFLKAGMPYDDLKVTRSNTLASYYQIDHPPLQGHDAVDDALSVTYAVQHHLRGGALDASDFG
ncbi:exonuclease [Phaeobacter sp. B1627]|uniref:exonuclease n=1 Tax=Phaeobacter sp. B1627 TaxID=2583809 RepID=UPI00111AA962|nr:exonuclease [Phaeobacter sp. B1627]TNJ41808.1 exonuclease [Phaeobacter sp. B1627]